LEVIADNDGNTYRTVYTVRLTAAVYVLHAFQKKSVRGIRTPQHEMDLVRSRLAWAQRIDAARIAEQKRQESDLQHKGEGQ